MRQRKDDVARVARDALRSREPVDHGERLLFAADDETERELGALVAAEAQCCSFLQLDLTREADALLLDVTGPDEARSIIAELFA